VWTVIGTLAGVVITAIFGLITTRIAQSWQYQRSEQEHRWAVARDLRTTRRETYARLIVAAEAIFHLALDYQTRQVRPIAMADFQKDLPLDLRKLDSDFEICRVQGTLLAGSEVTIAIGEYTNWLRNFWPKAASGNAASTVGEDAELSYPRLIRAMQAELAELPDDRGVSIG
jgi:hypothetical protein